AARSLLMSQPAVSQHVTALERELGAELVTRTTTGAALTASGSIVLRHALRMLQASDDTRRELAELRTGDTAPVRVAAFPSACSSLLPRATSAWLRSHPALSFEFTECDSDTALSLVLDGKADLGLVYDYAAHPLFFGDLAAQPLGDDPL